MKAFLQRVRILRWLVPVAVLVAACSEEGPEGGALRLQLQKGWTIRQWSLTDQTITQRLDGDAQITKQSIGLGTIYLVESVDASGLATMKVTYDSITFVQDGGLGLVTYNSADSLPPPGMATGYAAMLGKSYRVTLRRDGHVARVSGLDSLLDAIVDEVAKFQPAAREMIEFSMKSLFSEKSMVELLERSIAIYPDKPIPVGGSWSKEISVSNGTPMVVKSTYTLKSRENDTARIDLKSTIAANRSSEPLELAGMRITYDIAGTQEGTIEIDGTSGWIIGSRIKQNVAGEMDLKADSALSDRISSRRVPLEIRSIMTTRSWTKRQ